MNLRLLNKCNAHYWDKEETDWVVKDKDGLWWIIPGSHKDKKVDIPSKKIKQSSMKTNPERMILILVSALLGISLGLNVLAYLLK